jgi:hypothetical protein
MKPKPTRSLTFAQINTQNKKAYTRKARLLERLATRMYKAISAYCEESERQGIPAPNMFQRIPDIDSKPPVAIEAERLQKRAVAESRARGAANSAARKKQANLERDRRIHDAVNLGNKAPKAVAACENLSASRIRRIAGSPRR